jgi:biopolymer transport protein ExbD
LITNKAITVNLPAAGTGEESQSTPLRIEIAKTGEARIDGVVTDFPAMAVIAKKLGEKGKPVAASIAADRRAPHGAVMSAIDALRESGVQEFSFAVMAE